MIAGSTYAALARRIVPEPWSEEVRARLRRLGAAPPERADGAALGDAGRAGFD